MRGCYHRGAAFDRAANQRRDDFRAVMVERRKRLVEQQQHRIRKHRARRRKALLHPARERAHAGIGNVGQSDPAEPLLGRRARVGDRIKLGVEFEILARGQIRVEETLMRHQADSAPIARGEPARVLSEDQRVAGARCFEPGNDSQQRGFPGAVAADDKRARARQQPQFHVAQHGRQTVSLCQAASLDDRSRHHSVRAIAPRIGLIAIPHCAQNFESTAARVPHCGQKRILLDATTAGCCGGGGGARRFDVQDHRRHFGTARQRRGSARRRRQRCDRRLLRAHGLVGLEAKILDRGHRGQRSILERLVHRFVVRVGQLAHLAIELEFAKTLHRQRAFMLVALDLQARRPTWRALRRARYRAAPRRTARRRR